MSLNKVEKISVLPFARTPDAIRNELTSKPVGTASPYQDGGKRYLILRTDSGFEEIDITDIPSKNFMSSVNLENIADIITQRVDKNLPEFKDFQVVLLNSGQGIFLPYGEGKICMFCISARKPTYFDLCLYVQDEQKILTYNNKSIPGFRHSGDKTANAVTSSSNGLRHTISIVSPNEDKVILPHVVGYNKNPLHRYEKEVPTMVLVDHENKILYFVPIPLDKVTIGDATLCIPLVGRRIGDNIHWNVLSNPPTVNGVNTGELNDDVTGAFNCSRDMFLVAKEEKIVETKTEVISSNIEQPVSTKTSFTIPDVFTVVEKGIKVKGSKVNLVYGTGIDIYENSIPDTSSAEYILPCAVGELQGPLALAIGRNAKQSISWDTIVKLYNRSGITIFHVSDRMLDIVRNTTLYVANALFVVHVTKIDIDNEKIFIDSEYREDIMNKVNVNAVTAMAGPNSIVVIEFGGKVFFYRGVRWVGFLDDIPSFGEDVSFLLDKVNEFSVSENKNPWETLQKKDTSLIFFGGKEMKTSELLEEFKGLTLTTLNNNKEDILDVLTQPPDYFTIQKN